MRNDHPLRKSFEKELQELKESLQSLNSGRFRIFQITADNPQQVDITDSHKAHVQENIALYEQLLGEE